LQLNETNDLLCQLRLLRGSSGCPTGTLPLFARSVAAALRLPAGTCSLMKPTIFFAT